jgi:hypothetical protein
MEREGFSRAIKSDAGQWYHMPTAEYDRIAALTDEQVLNSAKRAADVTNKAYAIIVSNSAGRIWFGLPTVKAVVAVAWKVWSGRTMMAWAQRSIFDRHQCGASTVPAPAIEVSRQSSAFS